MTAVDFIRAAVSAEHKIHRVFFYGDGVLNSANNTPSATQKEWQKLSQTLQLELAICVTAATKRNLISRENPTSHSLIANRFTVSGLGQLADLAMHCDRVITFR